MSSTILRQLRVIGTFEGLSFLVLLLVAMPLKYWAGWPHAVRWVGMAHGILFIVYVAAGAYAGHSLRWPLPRTFGVLLAAVVPTGPFLIDGRLKRMQHELAERGV